MQKCAQFIWEAGHTHFPALCGGSECLPVGCSAGRGGGQSWRGGWSCSEMRVTHKQTQAYATFAYLSTSLLTATSSHISPTHTHAQMWRWTHTSFPVESVLISRSICTRQEITTSLAHINMSLLSFPQCPRVPVRVRTALVCVRRERAVNGVEAWIWLFNNFRLSQSVTEVRVCKPTHPFIHQPRYSTAKKVLANYIHYLDVWHKLFVVVWQQWSCINAPCMQTLDFLIWTVMERFILL